MTFALDAVAEPTHSPPRVALTATESDPDLSIQSVAFFRDGVPLRFEAAVTGDEAIAYDYDAPFDVALLYRADATEIGSTVDWDETWPDLSEWSGDVAHWAVSSGTAVAGTGSSPIYRDAADTIVALSVDVPDNVTLELTEGAGSTVVSVLVSPDGTVTLSGSTSSMVDGSGAFTLTLSDDSVTITGTGGPTWTTTVPYSGVPTRVQLTSEGGSVGEIEVRIAVDDPADVVASDTATLTGVEGAWLTNAAAPDLSILIDPADCQSGDYYIATSTRESTALDENTRTLEIEGSADVLTVASGPRRRETWTLDVACKTEAARKELLATLANSAPINLRFTASQDVLGLDDGFYAVGRVSTQRDVGPVVDPLTVVSLPLTPSRAPAYKPLWQWSWDTLVQTGMSWDDVAAAFATWNDVIVGPG